MAEKQFEKRLQLKLREISGKCPVELKRDEIIPSLETGDVVYEAAIELAIQVGLYHMGTNRVIEFSEEELRYAAKTRKTAFSLGEGKDRVTIRVRSVGDERPPINIIGPAGNPITEEFYVPIHLSYAQLPETHGLVPGSLIAARGFNNEPGTPGELLCVLTEAKMMREVARRAGKPGMVFGESPMSATSEFASIASYNPNGYRSTTSMIPMQVYPGLKIGWHQLNLSAYAQEFGIEPFSMAFIVLGAFSRNPLETAILATAGCLMLVSINHANMLYSGTVPARAVDPRAMMQTEVLKLLSLGRNAGISIASTCGGFAGACTKRVLYENCLMAFTQAAAGCAILTFGMASGGLVPNGSTGMEGKMVCEAGIASTGLDRKEANRIINNIYALYEDQYYTPLAGKPFPECYDVTKVTPTDEYKKIYDGAKTDLKAAGVPFKY